MLSHALHTSMVPAGCGPGGPTRGACAHACMSGVLTGRGRPCRDESNDSCGFEHVFVGEIDDGHVKGLHNWLQTMVEEARGNLDYMGFVLPKRAYQDDGDEDVDGDRNLISVQLGWEVRPARFACFACCAVDICCLDDIAQRLCPRGCCVYSCVGPCGYMRSRALTGSALRTENSIRWRSKAVAEHAFQHGRGMDGAVWSACCGAETSAGAAEAVRVYMCGWRRRCSGGRRCRAFP